MALREELTLHEGLRLKAYDDANGNDIIAGDTLEGHPTIGVGRNIAGDGLGITEEESRYLLANDVERVEKEIEHWGFMNDLNEPRQAVIYDMVFNMGVTRFNANKWVKTFAAIQNEDWEDAANQMLDSRWAKQVGQRAIRLSQMMRKGTWYAD